MTRCSALCNFNLINYSIFQKNKLRRTWVGLASLSTSVGRIPCLFLARFLAGVVSVVVSFVFVLFAPVEVPDVLAGSASPGFVLWYIPVEVEAPVLVDPEAPSVRALFCEEVPETGSAAALALRLPPDLLLAPKLTLVLRFLGELVVFRGPGMEVCNEKN